MHILVDRSWKGKITTNWDNGSPPRTFRLHPENDVPDRTSLKGTFEGYGSTVNGRAFDIRRGRYSIRSDGSVDFSFDMRFGPGEPTETCSGRVNSAETKLTGSIRLKNPSEYDGPQTGGVYAGYNASITLY
jgi:hypothetical protein